MEKLFIENFCISFLLSPNKEVLQIFLISELMKKHGINNIPLNVSDSYFMVVVKLLAKLKALTREHARESKSDARK